MRLPWPALAGGTLVVALGAAGLVRGAMPQPAASAAEPVDDPIVVAGAYVRPPVAPTKYAAGYFVVYNRSNEPDTLIGISSGAGASTQLHRGTVGGAMQAVTRTTIPAKGKLVLSTGKAHVMIGSLFGPLRDGDRVSFEIQMRNAGPIDFVAPVVPFGKNPPAAAQPSGGAS